MSSSITRVAVLLGLILVVSTASLSDLCKELTAYSASTQNHSLENLPSNLALKRCTVLRAKQEQNANEQLEWKLCEEINEVGKRKCATFPRLTLTNLSISEGDPCSSYSEALENVSVSEFQSPDSTNISSIIYQYLKSPKDKSVSSLLECRGLCVSPDTAPICELAVQLYVATTASGGATTAGGVATTAGGVRDSVAPVNHEDTSENSQADQRKDNVEATSNGSDRKPADVATGVSVSSTLNDPIPQSSTADIAPPLKNDIKNEVTEKDNKTKTSNPGARPTLVANTPKDSQAKSTQGQDETSKMLDNSGLDQDMETTMKTIETKTAEITASSKLLQNTVSKTVPINKVSDKNKKQKPEGSNNNQPDYGVSNSEKSTTQEVKKPDQDQDEPTIPVETTSGSTAVKLPNEPNSQETLEKPTANSGNDDGKSAEKPANSGNDDTKNAEKPIANSGNDNAKTAEKPTANSGNDNAKTAEKPTANSGNDDAKTAGNPIANSGNDDAKTAGNPQEGEQLEVPSVQGGKPQPETPNKDPLLNDDEAVDNLDKDFSEDDTGGDDSVKDEGKASDDDVASEINVDSLNQANTGGPSPEFSQEDSHFFVYFLTVIIVIILAYLVVHNKQKILGLIVEGRGSQRRRSHSYRKLDTDGTKGSQMIF